MRKAKEILRTAGAAAAAIAFFFLLWRPAGLPVLICAALAVAMYFGMYFLLKPGAKIGRVQVENLKDGVESLETMEEAKRDIASIESKLPAIRSDEVRRSVSGLIGTGRKILAYLTEHPEKISRATRFTDYYLDTAEKLVDRYADLQQADLTEPGQNAAGEIIQQTQDGLQMLNQAFDKQLSRLLEGDRMEIETDIKVLKETIEMEGDS